jgi:DNA-cytosine methyltransferase
MKYLSLFSGIGGFEYAIHKIFLNAECIGYSEIKPHAIKVYEHHYHNHKNLGDITKIQDECIKSLVKEKGCDIIVGGFPCTNLTTIANIKGNNKGLEGPQSKLFYNMLHIISIIMEINPCCHVVIENNASMSNNNKELITTELNKVFKNIHRTRINSSEFGVQSRNRIFWTTFHIPSPHNECSQIWDDVLEKDIDSKYYLSEQGIENMNRGIKCKQTPPYYITLSDNELYLIPNVGDKETYKKTRWQLSMHSDTGNEDVLFYKYPVGKSRPIYSGNGGGTSSSILLDRRDNKCLARRFTPIEKERLFFLPDNYTDVDISISKRGDLLGNCVVVSVIQYILSYLKAS